MATPNQQGGPFVPESAVKNYQTGQMAKNVLYDTGLAMTNGIRVVKLNDDQKFSNLQYAVSPFLVVGNDVAHAAQTFHINTVSASEFHIVSDNNASISVVGFIAFGD